MLKKVLITGGAGFIGSHVADLLIKENYDVIIVDNLSRGKIENINLKAAFYKIDISNEELKDVFAREKPEIVIHMAAQLDIRISVEDPVTDANQNIIASLKLLEYCKLFGIEKIIFSSTGGAIYGEQDYFPADEVHVQNPISPYGIAKLAVEKYIYFYYQKFNLKFVNFRYANIYGPRQDFSGEGSVVAVFIDKILNNKQPVIFGDGKQTRDFVFIEDVVKFNLLAIQNDIVGNFNIGTSIETNIIELFDLIKEITGKKIDKKNVPAKAGETIRSVLTFQKAFQAFGHKPAIDLKTGIQKTVNCFRAAT